MQIQLRTPDFVRRLAERFDRHPDGIGSYPHHKRLLALAAMYGYSSWEDLVASCRADAPPVIFDQDMTETERYVRWLSMAKNVSQQLELILPHALTLVQWIRPTQDFTRPPTRWNDMHDVFQVAFLELTDLFWIAASEGGHPLVPPGFMHAKAIPLSVLAEWRLANKNLPDFGPYNVFCDSFAFVLVGNDMAKMGPFPGMYLKREDLLLINPIPPGDSVLSPNASESKKFLDIFFKEKYPRNTPEQNNAQLAEWVSSRKALFKEAGLPVNTKTRWAQVMIGCREKLGGTWYWPLHVVNPESPPALAAKEEALRIDALIKNACGKDAKVFTN